MRPNPGATWSARREAKRASVCSVVFTWPENSPRPFPALPISAWNWAALARNSTISDPAVAVSASAGLRHGGENAVPQPIRDDLDRPLRLIGQRARQGGLRGDTGMMDAREDVAPEGETLFRVDRGERLPGPRLEAAQAAALRGFVMGLRPEFEEPEDERALARAPDRRSPGDLRFVDLHLDREPLCRLSRPAVNVLGCGLADDLAPGRQRFLQQALTHDRGQLAEQAVERLQALDVDTCGELRHDSVPPEPPRSATPWRAGSRRDSVLARPWRLRPPARRRPSTRSTRDWRSGAEARRPACLTAPRDGRSSAVLAGSSVSHERLEVFLAEAAESLGDREDAIEGRRAFFTERDDVVVGEHPHPVFVHDRPRYEVGPEVDEVLLAILAAADVAALLEGVALDALESPHQHGEIPFGHIHAFGLDVLRGETLRAEVHP